MQGVGRSAVFSKAYKIYKVQFNPWWLHRSKGTFVQLDYKKLYQQNVDFVFQIKCKLQINSSSFISRFMSQLDTESVQVVQETLCAQEITSPLLSSMQCK